MTDPTPLLDQLEQYRTAADLLTIQVRATAQARAEHERAADLLADARLFAEATTPSRADVRRHTDEQEKMHRSARERYRLEDAELEAARIAERYHREALITHRVVYQRQEA